MPSTKALRVTRTRTEFPPRIQDGTELTTGGGVGPAGPPGPPGPGPPYAQADVTGLVADLAARELLANKNVASGYAGLDAGSKIAGTQQVYGAAVNTAAQGNDARLSDARTPTAHAVSHAAGGTDPVTLTEAQITNLVADLALKADLASPALTGVPTAPTAAPGTNTTQVATMAAVTQRAETFGLDTSALTGAQNNWTPTLSTSLTVIEWSGAADVAFTGMVKTLARQIVIIKNTGTKVATFAHQSGSSAAGNKFRNLVTSGVTPIAAGGFIAYEHDGTDWQLIGHEQGAWITPTYAAGDFTASGAMTWTVDAGDVVGRSYRVSGKTLSLGFYLLTTTVAGTPSNQLKIANPNGYTNANRIFNGTVALDNGAVLPAYIDSGAIGSTVTSFYLNSGANWAAATNNTALLGSTSYEIT